MQLFAITDRTLFAAPGALIGQAVWWAKGGIDFIQIREKDMAGADLAALAVQIVDAVRPIGRRTRVLLNGPPELAAEAGCDGVHLTGGLPGDTIAKARETMSTVLPSPIISVSCHTISEVERARDHGATLALFAPVFEKRSSTTVVHGQGLSALADACRIALPMPVFALGGITVRNARDCINAGAAGIAAIRLFAAGDWQHLRSAV